MSHPRRKDPGKRAAQAVAETSAREDPCIRDAPGLLAAVAAALNDCEHAGIFVRLAHDAVITDTGYVFALDRPRAEPWVVRSQQLAPFPVVPGDD